jgi:hypothetical protein
VIQTQGKTRMKKLMLVAGLAFAAITGAHARLGWSYEDCVKKWGQPTANLDSAAVDAPGFNFYAGNGVYAQAWFLNGTVQCMTYASKDKSLLEDNVEKFLQTNLKGLWTSYIDVEPKVEKSWRFDVNNRMLAYAQLRKDQDTSGWYYLHVSSVIWSEHLNKIKPSTSTPTDTTTSNINI